MSDAKALANQADLRPLGQLSGSEVEEGLAGLRAHSIQERYVRRLCRVGQAHFVLGIRFPTRSRRDLQDPERPWLDSYAAQSSFEFHPLDRAAALLSDPDGPEAEMERRERLNAEQQERERAAAEERRRLAEERAQAEREDQELEQQTRRQFQGSFWDSQSPLAQAFYLLALAHEDKGDPETAARCRGIAAQARDGERPLAFPRREWKR